MPVIPDPSFPQEVETRSLDHFRFALDAIGTEEDRGTEDALEGFDEPSVFFSTFAHTEGMEHLGARTESNRLTLLLDGQRSQIDQNQPILSIRQPELGMPCGSAAESSRSSSRTEVDPPVVSGRAARTPRMAWN